MGLPSYRKCVEMYCTCGFVGIVKDGRLIRELIVNL